MNWSHGSRRFRDSCTAVQHGRRIVVLASAVLALVCSAALAFAHDASEIPTPRIASTGTVHAGETVEIRWDALPRGVDEMELVLSVDGGRHYPIRLTAEMSGRENAFRWRVPNLGVREARLRLRAHHQGLEVESGPSSEFTIVADASRPPELEQVHEGQWWDGFDPIDVDARGLSGTHPEFHERAGGTDGVAPRRGRLLTVPTEPPGSVLVWSAARAAAAPAPHQPGAPTFRPRRE